jgi:hypothetical protein
VHVKTPNLVHGLGDYFRKVYPTKNTQEESLSLSPSLKRAVSPQKNHDDSWAMSYVTVMNLEPVLEAFDRDVSGYVSIEEANAMTSSRPKDWR